ncbi:MAG: hypothetical protein KDB80_04305, partial [Planctomycetes bacterium]|nr:hypothetical protein [Planctomycetota bacterium]
EGRTKSVRDDAFPHPDQALNSNTYPKGAWVLHMLRQEIGDQSFFRALRAYVDRFRGRSVVTRDFIDAVEESSGRELDWFFEQWLDRKGCPELRVSTSGRRIIVEQVQRDRPYRFELRIAWIDDAGTRTTRTMLVADRKATFDTESEVVSVELDPDVELLFRPAKEPDEEPK